MSRKANAAASLRDALEPRLRKLVQEIWAQQEAARDFGDPEGVHQMRVASRKLRAAIDASDGVFTRKPERQLRSQVRRLTRALGAVRDGDVMIEDMQERRSDNGDHPGVDRLIERLDHQRETDRARLLALLEELDASGFRDASQKVFAGKPGNTTKLRRKEARRLIQSPLDAFRTITNVIPEESDVEALHLIRIATKRLRYALQLVETPLASASTQALGSLGTMQDQLGDIHNDDVLIALIRDELHALVEESIANVSDRQDVPDGLTDEAAPDPRAVAAWNDLLGVLLSATRDRHQRYSTFVTWWADLHATGFPAQLQAIDGQKPGASGAR